MLMELLYACSHYTWKLPVDVRRNLAHEHGNSEWTIRELKDAILKEIRVLESGWFTNEVSRVFVCPPLTVRLLIPTGVMWCDMNSIYSWLYKLYTIMLWQLSHNCSWYR